ncbi:hypothetical protein LWC34_22620 [Kibdelosporangium philippinense]|uniref:DUF3093 domain-containing protein n=1 Tax=Kibdelosporangium philippinense TaxID=211113 RepID=A0ABS8ZGF4_9PSEU|nr:hypothetical protein [Kibdelosporangium philippinense]MCE7005598.1 hypothetical protein [Kibdelosporangium philippinense]
MTAPVFYSEPGSTWWPVLWGPVFALVGATVEWTTGPVHVVAWVIVAFLFAGAAAVWVQARRRICSVELTHLTLRQGREELPLDQIAAADEEVGTPMAARVLGGGLAVPRKFESVPLKLWDGTTVLAWAQDGEALRAALRERIDS